MYGRQRKNELKLIEDFDPCLVEFKGKAKDYLKIFLNNVRGQGLGVSLLLDDAGLATQYRHFLIPYQLSKNCRIE